MSSQVPPEGLGEAGSALWADVLAVYVLDPAELAMLREACRLVDELERLVVALRDAEVTAAGSTGQVRAHPLLDEVRKHRAAFAAALAALRLPVDGERVGRATASERGSAAARARWAPTAIERAERKGGRRGASA